MFTQVVTALTADVLFVVILKEKDNYNVERDSFTTNSDAFQQTLYDSRTTSSSMLREQFRIKFGTVLNSLLEQTYYKIVITI